MSVNYKFEPRMKESDHPQTILLKFYFDKKRFTCSLGPNILVYPSLWNYDTHRPILGRNKSEREMISPYRKTDANIETKLKNVNTNIENCIRICEQYFLYKSTQNEKVDFAELKETIKDNLGIEQRSQRNTDSLTEYLHQFIKDMETGKRTYKSRNGESKRYQEGTIKGYRLLEKHLSHYQAQNNKRYMRFDDITIAFYDELDAYFSASGYTANYFGKIVKNLKCIMRAAQEENLHQNEDYKQKTFKRTRNSTLAIALTQSELDRIQNLDLLHDTRLAQYRDMFVVGCYTAQRFSDYSRLGTKYINANNQLEFHQKKTGTKVIVPLSEDVRTILEKYGEFPEITKQTLNKALKKIAELAGINEEIEIQEVKDGFTTTKHIPKHQLITSHVARRTGCTLMYQNGVPEWHLIKISGHSSPDILRSYIRIDKKETARLLADNPFFKSTPLKVVK